MATETNLPLELIRFKFTSEDLEFLSAHKEEWQAATRTERSQIATRVYEAMKKENKNWTVEEKKLKKDGVYTWFHMYGRKRESAEKFKRVKRWTARSVFGTEVQDELKKTIRLKTGGWNEASSKVDNQKAFGQYQAELSRLWENTSTAERDRLAGLAELWNRMGPSPDQQAKQVHKMNAEKASKYIRSFCKQMKKSCGMDCVILTCHKNQKGTIEANAYEYMRELGGMSFFQSNPDWEMKPIMALVSNHGKQMHESQDCEVFVQQGSNRKPYLNLETDDEGHPILPDPSQWPKKGMDKKALVRSYVAIAYRQATSKDNGIPPWTSIVQKLEDYFDLDQVPDGFTLLDPSKMKDPQVQELLDFWHKKQEEGEDGIGFQFQETSSSLSRRRRQDSSVAHSESGTPGRKNKGKGRAKAGGEEMKWTDHIQPDSRRRQTRKPRTDSVGLDSSGEEFDFSQFSDSESSEGSTTVNEAGNHHKPSSYSSTVGHVVKVKGGSGSGPATKNKIQDMTGLRRSTFGPKSKRGNLPMVNDADIDDETAGSKITGRRLAAKLTHEAVEQASGSVRVAPGGQGSESKKRMIVEVEIKPRKKAKISQDNNVKRPAPSQRVTRSRSVGINPPSESLQSLSAQFGPRQKATGHRKRRR